MKFVIPVDNLSKSDVLKILKKYKQYINLSFFTRKERKEKFKKLNL